ncbi:SIMPL domain-containing protein [Ichthyobacterium seriolicida]|uniref:SIMPL domain-containing protein n=1 Tax=Ichthyobacterium seriolicida TaxID=242600 RepID=A0A1J1DX87_9FLAO|nr:SIMPL domain-containing protein [Ichthyobacterium seriolicida]BAV94463.1 hypothetical protein JBKA6_0450 [Ichthyobacterium seriolicida]
MNNKKITLSLLIISISLVISAVIISDVVVNSRKFNRSIVIKGSVQREVKADLGIWYLYMKDVSDTLSDTQKKAALKLKLMYEYLESKGIKKSEIMHNMTYVYDPMKNEFYSPNTLEKQKFFSTLKLVISTRNVDGLQRAILDTSSLISKGLAVTTEPWHVKYLFTKLNDIKLEMIEEATKNARESAEKFALNSNSKVGRIKRANQGNFSFENTYTYDDRLMIKKIKVVSTIEFYLID